MSTAEQQHPSPRSRSRAIIAALPTLVVLGCLAAVGYWGHHTGWRAPKLAQLFGMSAEGSAEDWCVEHNVPESRCIACHPELAGESAADWCKEHGVAESKCTACHPEILTTGIAGDWCREHGLPESGCTLCHPEIARTDLTADENEVVVARDSNDPADTGGVDAKPFRDPRTCQTHALKVQFASVAAMAKVGIRLGKVVERPMAEALVVNAEVDYDQARFAKLASRVSGTARSVERDLGQSVRAGDVLALIDSAEVGRAKAELLQAQAAVDVASRSLARLKASSEAGFRTEAERLAGEAGAREADIRLLNARQALGNFGLTLPSGRVEESAILTLGLSEQLLEKNSLSSVSANVFPLIAPFDGVIVAREVVMGEVVEPTRALFEIADTSRLWVTMDVPEADSRRVAMGGEILFRPDYAPDEAVVGRIAWISTAVDETTRTIKVRAEVPNEVGQLRAHSFGKSQIVVRANAQAIAVPTESVQWEGCCNVVFVRLADDIFQTRKVQIGTRDLAYTEVLGGVLPGEVVVTAGSHVLKSEILKSRLGAGCCAEE